ncbi:MAG: hypothetical protein ACJASQ_001009 [Crocinitomicaceae bacterium]|jgi:hypothetical protein
MNSNTEILDEPTPEEEVVTTAIPYAGEKTDHYNDNSILLKGLLGLILCVTPGSIIGLIFIKLSLDQAREARKSTELTPGKYTEKSLKKIRVDRTFAYIGLGLFIFEILFLFVYMTFV